MMKNFSVLIALMAALAIAACSSKESGDNASPEAVAPVDEAQAGPPKEIAPGLTMRILREGDGEAAAPGMIAIVHYTGWLFDAEAPNNRGQKFDSSHDRDQHFQFPLGANPRQVIEGWDTGVVGMKVGEIRELVIAPEMGYGERGAGNVIPPGATLVFEVELANVQSVEPDGIQMTEPEVVEPGSSE